MKMNFDIFEALKKHLRRSKEEKPAIEPDERFWKLWTESTTGYSTIFKIMEIRTQ